MYMEKVITKRRLYDHFINMPTCCYSFWRKERNIYFCTLSFKTIMNLYIAVRTKVKKTAY